MSSVVIAAHNEEAVIGACLDALLGQTTSEPVHIVVSANGCVDKTVEIARRYAVTVLDRPEPGKAAALNAGDDAAEGFPRIYLDADIIVPPGGLEAVLRRLGPETLVAVPARRLDLRDRAWPVRGFYAINERLPAYTNGLFGRGMIAVSADGRARFGRFPHVVADDLFLDSQFSDAEKGEASDVAVVVEAPYTTRDLVRRLVRVRRGNAEMRAAGGTGEIEVNVRRADRWAWLRDVVVPHPRLVFPAVPYLAITVWAALQARRSRTRAAQWGRDESTRRIAATDGGGDAS
ncbi:MAG TPA: glycosyltransferase [Microbacterium sp.]|uniref:glycosyltransferase n=1 Tax=Microbacterium sp. TaxID=51671 RepID=UPI002C3AEC3D|nr:glycosyltransferase [Microbacterium sp.]HWI31334.1 glycosyltransferase [Microbacterium sp.]